MLDILPGYKIVLQNLEEVKLSKDKKKLHEYLTVAINAIMKVLLIRKL